MRDSLRQASAVALNQLLRFAADWRGVLILFLIPLAFNLVLGVSLRQAFAPDFRPDRPYRVAVAVPPAHPAADVLQRVLTGAEADGWITVQEVAGADAAVAAVRRRVVEVAVVMSPDFPEDPLQVVAEPGTVPASLVESLAREAAAAATAGAGGAQPAGPVPVDLTLRPAPLPDEPAGGEGSAGPPPVDAMAYYAAGMAVMMVYFATREGTQGYLRDRATGVYLRVRAAGTGRAAYLGGTFAGSVAVGLVFMTVMALTTRLLFGVHWGDLGGWALLTLASVLAAAGVNTLLLAFARSPEVQEGVSTALAQVLGFLGGSMMPLFIFPDILARVSQWVPNRWMLDGYLALMAGAAPAAVRDEALHLVAAGAVLLILGWFLDQLAARTAGEA
ncbi:MULTISPECIES: ABC transporter permease [Thermaerobacter]|uniref:ABC transporter permease n=1 Tax=Thermaerobacter composti TaxID=554949 RepID=A0ABZ0QQ33_9FIRM|nr:MULTISPECIES: ABC transporter permease [Thermaerobacter]PZN09503.1 MAG: ABC transporter permease [Bacillota bacterium]QBS36887.1 ABC transporter permease [Thermaerobacter sp. FW80]WPD18872.1 ABC transporter permease [Thermaerobacter composti]